MRQFIEHIMSLPKTLWINFRSLPIRHAVDLPIWVSWRTKFVSLRGKIILETPVRFGMLRFGFGGAATTKHMPCVIENNGIIIAGEKSYFGGGCQICTISPKSVIKIGKECKFMGECHIVSAKEVIFGDKCMVSWNTQIMDTDMHSIKHLNEYCNPDSTIRIEDHVWICSRVAVMKGTTVKSGAILSCGSIIYGKCDSNAVYTGLPLRKLKDNVEWGEQYWD